MGAQPLVQSCEEMPKTCPSPTEEGCIEANGLYMKVNTGSKIEEICRFNAGDSTKTANKAFVVEKEASCPEGFKPWKSEGGKYFMETKGCRVTNKNGNDGSMLYPKNSAPKGLLDEPFVCGIPSLTESGCCPNAGCSDPNPTKILDIEGSAWGLKDKPNEAKREYSHGADNGQIYKAVWNGVRVSNINGEYPADPQDRCGSGGGAGILWVRARITAIGCVKA